MFFTSRARRLARLALACLGSLTGSAAMAQTSPAPSPTPTEVVVHQRLKDALQAGDAQGALNAAQQRLRTHPQDVQARFAEAVALTQLGQTAEALAAYERLTQRFPELPEPHNNLAVLLASAQRWDEATAALQTAVRLNPGYGTAWRNLADLYTQLADLARQRAAALPEDKKKP